VAVIGGGPGGYAAAFLAADLGLNVTLIDLEKYPGGVCIYRGCIPSKALLHAAKLLKEAREADQMGIKYAKPEIDLDRLRTWKEEVVNKHTDGLGQLVKARKITYIQGRAKLTGPTTIDIELADGGKQSLTAEHIVLATGSRPAVIPGLPADSPRVMDSTKALDLEDVPENLLVIGGNYIGLELGTVYAALGSKVTIVEMLPDLAPGTDRDLARILVKELEKDFHQIMTGSKAIEFKEQKKGIKVKIQNDKDEVSEHTFDKVLYAVGRKPNSENLGLENTKVELDERGYVKVDEQRRTAEPTIFAIGDLIGGPLLAHKAMPEGKVAVEVIAGHKVAFEPRVIPGVIYTDPEIATTGLTETEAKAKGINVEVVRFPWAASGRATSMNRPDGLTKLIINPETEQVLGVGIVGINAGELITEGSLAVEMAALAKDVELTIHPHPTLSETVMEAAEAFFGQATSIYRPKRDRKK
jgi:dihydrolipoamide dehydrogenase